MTLNALNPKKLPKIDELFKACSCFLSQGGTKIDDLENFDEILYDEIKFLNNFIRDPSSYTVVSS